MKTQKLTVMALTTAIALVLSFIESQIPAFVAVPGVKMGLANIAIVYALYRLGWKEAALISLIRVVLVSLLFGSAASFLYSLAGAVLSLLGMALLKKTGKFTEIVVSVAGGVLHNIGQIAMASIILETDALRYYLPFLLVSGILAGVVIGLISGILAQGFTEKEENSCQSSAPSLFRTRRSSCRRSEEGKRRKSPQPMQPTGKRRHW